MPAINAYISPKSGWQGNVPSTATIIGCLQAEAGSSPLKLDRRRNGVDAHRHQMFANPGEQLTGAVRRSDKACLETVKAPPMDLLREVLPIDSAMSSVFGHFIPLNQAILTKFPFHGRYWKNPKIPPGFPNQQETRIPIQGRKNQGSVRLLVRRVNPAGTPPQH